MNAATTPGNAAWLRASPTNASPLRTTYEPTTAQSRPTSAEAASERTKKSNPSGPRIRSTADPSRRSGAAPAAVLVVVPLARGRVVMVVRIVEQDRLAAEHQEVAAVRPRED